MLALDTRKIGGLMVVIASCLHGWVSAQVMLPEKQNVISFSTVAQEEVTQDVLMITLQANKEGSVASEVQASLKRELEFALSEARKEAEPEEMEVRTGYFAIHPSYGHQGRINGWQGKAQLVLQGKNMPRIAQMAGKLNQLNVVNVEYGVSKGLRKQYEDRLTDQAIESFRSKAKKMAQAFGFLHYKLGEVNIQTGEPGFYGHRPMAMMTRGAKAMDAEAAVPVEPGKGLVSATVSGHVVLTP